MAVDLRKVRDRLVVDRDGRFDLAGEVAEAGAEDDAGARRLVPLRANGGGGGFDLGVEFEHGVI